MRLHLLLKSDLFYFQVLLCAGATIYPLWSVFLYMALPKAYDMPLGRALVGSLFFAVLVGSRTSDWVKTHIERLTYLCLLILAVHYYSIIYWYSAMTPVYFLGALIVSSTTSSVFRNGFYLIGYSALVLCTAFLTTILIDATYGSHSMLFFGLLNIHGVAIVVTFSIANLTRQLEMERLRSLKSDRLRSVGVMASGIAHEINNPLSVIDGLIFKIKKQIPNEDRARLDLDPILEKMEITSRRIVKIVRGLKAFSRDGAMDKMELVTLNSIFNETFSFCEGKLKKDDVRLFIHDISDLLVVRCRPTEISQILLNLITNASDAVAELEERWVKIDAIKEGTNVVIKITDSGKGIDPKIVDKIIDPFFTTKSIGKGTGLGLSISHGIAKDHGGDLVVNSKYPNTQFILTLPTGMSAGSNDDQKNAA